MKRSPWTPDEVAALQRRQANPYLHPYTCPRHSNYALVPTENGWECARFFCRYHQDWAHAADLNGSTDGLGDPFEMRAL
jgi:hypothetical protein